MKSPNKIKTILTRFTSYSLLTQLMFIFVVTSVIPILAVQCFNYFYLRGNLEQRSLKVLSTDVNRLTRSINKEFGNIENLINAVVYDPSFMNNIVKLDSDHPNISATARVDLNRDVVTSIYSNDNIRFVTIELPNNKRLYINHRSPSSLYPSLAWERKDLLLKNLEYNKHQNIYNPTEYIDFQGQTDPAYCFSISRVIYNDFSGQALGLFTVYLDEKLMSDICRDSFQSYQDELNNLFIMSPNNRIVSDLNRTNLCRDGVALYLDSSIGSDIFYSQQLSHSIKLNGERYILSSETIPNTDWHIVFLVRSDFVTHDTEWMMKITIVVCAIILILTFCIFTVITSRISNSVKQIVTGIDKAKSGDLKQPVTMDSKNELTRIASSFNSFTSTIDRLIKELKDQMEQTNKAISNEKDAELHALEAQINPHFLYNTIDTINWVAIDHEEYEISSMLSQLASMLRYSIKGVDHIVSVHQEVLWMEQYLFLQQKRFSESFTYHLTIEETILDCKIHKLLFQPIVENCVIHGFKGIDSGGIITISGGQFSESLLQFTITDNGNGMTMEDLDHILLESHEGSSSIGVRNVASRLDAYYGKQASLTIDSKPGNGTVCTLSIPLVR